MNNYPKPHRSLHSKIYARTPIRKIPSRALYSRLRYKTIIARPKPSKYQSLLPYVPPTAEQFQKLLKYFVECTYLIDYMRNSSKLGEYGNNIYFSNKDVRRHCVYTLFLAILDGYDPEAGEMATIRTESNVFVRVDPCVLMLL